jgi:hypothetical protein
MREICMSGLTSGDWRRSHANPDCGGGAKAPPTTHRKANATAPVVDSTTGAWWQVVDVDFDAEFVGQPLQFAFP